MREMKTVREVFSKAFGEVPEGATCHIGSQDCAGIYIGATHYVPFYKRMMDADKDKWVVSCTEDLYGPDISNRDAEAFRGFFGSEYDQALDELKETK
jgi:hypothetical protein